MATSSIVVFEGNDRPRSRTRIIGLAVFLGGLGLLLSACTAGSSTKAVKTVTPVPSATKTISAAQSSPTVSASPKPAAAPVHVRLLESDGTTYGIGMPIIAYFSAKITDASAFAKATTVTVNGANAGGAWYFENSAQSAGYPLEAHYRPQTYWPAHASIQMNMPINGVSAGPGLVFDDNLTLSMNTGAAHLANVDGTPGVDTMTITSDGAPVKTLKVSLGEAHTPTYLGTAVVMEKDNPQQMVSAPGEPYYNISVPWSVRMTNDGEFIHDAYWNGQIGQQNLSHGCTNLSPADAEWYYNWSQIGDPVTWTNTGGSQMPSWDGYGDWNVPWSIWQQGGDVPTTSS